MELNDFIHKEEGKNMAITLIGLNAIYPVGSIYMSVNDTNPTVLFGGT